MRTPTTWPNKLQKHDLLKEGVQISTNEFKIGGHGDSDHVLLLDIYRCSSIYDWVALQ
jgi:hypothetical protein